MLPPGQGCDAIGGSGGSAEVVGDDNDPLAEDAVGTNPTNMGKDGEKPRCQQSQP